MVAELARAQFADPRWRLANLYWIIDKDGKRAQFIPNWAQQTLLENLHEQNVILKARQLGFTTFIQLFMLDACLFNSNIRAGTIAHRLEDAKTIFRDKIIYPYENLPEGLKALRSKLRDSAEELLLSNNSSIRVATSMRSGTLQYLHVSEYGPLCAMFPDRAREVRTGALNTVQSGQLVFIESTAEGREGHFYELCENAQAKQRMSTPLTPLDFKFHFFPWWKNPEYELDPGVVIPEPFARYFDKLRETAGIELTPRQRAWYVKKAETQLADMKREYPSTPEEAFEASVEGAYYADQMAAAEMQGRIGEHRALPGVAVNTAWDIGRSDSTSVWFWQKTAGKVGLVGYYENSGEGMPFYIQKLKEYRARFGWEYGVHLLPHDAKVVEWGSDRTRVEQFAAAIRGGDLGQYLKVIPEHRIDDGINAARETLRQCWFDEAECSQGLKALRAYRKEWDENHGTWKDKPRHDWASHGSDAFRYLAMGWREAQPEPPKEKTPREIARDMCRPRTWGDLWKQYVEENELEVDEDYAEID
jgi:hypothetical protein